jgi:hypothetical protein
MYIYLHRNEFKIFGKLLAEENIYTKNCNFRAEALIIWNLQTSAPKFIQSDGI